MYQNKSGSIYNPTNMLSVNDVRSFLFSERFYVTSTLKTVYRILIIFVILYFSMPKKTILNNVVKRK